MDMILTFDLVKMVKVIGPQCHFKRPYCSWNFEGFFDWIFIYLLKFALNFSLTLAQFYRWESECIRAYILFALFATLFSIENLLTEQTPKFTDFLHMLRWTHTSISLLPETIEFLCKVIWMTFRNLKAKSMDVWRFIIKLQVSDIQEFEHQG